MANSRRRLLQLGAAALGVGAAAVAFPETIKKLLAIPANRRTGTIQDVEHVIILMQENRSFDHYYGTLRGVRGFSDPHPISLPGGNPVWQQPAGEGKTLSPFRLDTEKTAALIVPSLDHGWKQTHDLWKHHDAWIAKKTAMTMGYFTRADMPFHYALADAFTICDNYHCSVFGPTNPNRLFLWTGTSGLAVGNDGKQAIDNPDGDTNGTADQANDTKTFKPFAWKTYAERLEEAGIDWKVYQEYDNFSDNPLAYFRQFRNLDKNSRFYKRARAWAEGSNAYNIRKSYGEYLLAEMEGAIKAGKLPQVSWVVTSTMLSEHPAGSSPAYGEIFISNLLAMLAKHPDVWAKTVLFINYDENDGLFDHMPLPIPAISPEIGKSTIAATGEVYHGVPMGLGPRVPMTIVSPWTKGGFVDSELFDHSSVLRFLEARFGISEPNITPWRRAVCGDLTSAFDFSTAHEMWGLDLPDTSSYARQIDAAQDLPMTKPVYGALLPRQEKGQRPARPLPYDFDCNAKMDAGWLAVRLNNRGKAGACFIAYAEGKSEGPWFYTVEAGKTLEDRIAISGSAYHFTLHGPNGLFRSYQGEGAALSAELAQSADAVTLTVTNHGATEQVLAVEDGYAPGAKRTHRIAAGQSIRDRWDIAKRDHWYDLALSAGAQSWRFAGHVETGAVSRSDPALG